MKAKGLFSGLLLPLLIATAVTSTVVTPTLVAESEDLYTNVYVVPPTFLDGPPSPDDWMEDPFADPDSVQAKRTAKEVLESVGVSFGVGASAIYNPATSQIIVRNTQVQLELVEAYIDSLVAYVPKQIYLTFREAILAPEASEDFDWIFADPADANQADGSEGSATQARAFRSLEAFQEELSRPPSPIEDSETNMGPVAIAGVFTDPQFQVVIRAISQSQHADLLQPPSVMVRSGQPALSQLDERRYGVVAEIGADEFTLDMKLFVPPVGKPLLQEGDALQTPHQVTIWDGQTVAVTKKQEDGSVRAIFATARIVDPAGLPIERDEDPDRNAPPEPAVEPPAESVDQFAPEARATDPLGEAEKQAVIVADRLAATGSNLIAEGKKTEAIEFFGEALRILPDHEATRERKRCYLLRFIEASWESPAESGSDEEAESHHVHRVERGESLYSIARTYEASVAQLLKLNRLEGTDLEVGQLLIVPLTLPSWEEVSEPLEKILRETIIARVDFESITLEEALRAIHRQVLEAADPGLFPGPRPQLVIDEEILEPTTEITLRLMNVPASEALRYVTQLGNCSYHVEGATIRVLPLPSKKSPAGP